MSGFSVKAYSGDYSDSAPPGNHPAVLVALVDLGTQKSDYKGKISWNRKVYMCWELVNEKIDGTKAVNHVIGRDFAVYFSPKAALRGFVEKWRGKAFAEGEDFDLGVLLGQACLLNVIHKPSGDKMYPRVEGVSKVPKGMKVEKPQRTPFKWMIGEGKYPDPDWIPYLYGQPLRDHIAQADELHGGLNVGKRDAKPEPEMAGVGRSAEDDEAPF